MLLSIALHALAVAAAPAPAVANPGHALAPAIAKRASPCRARSNPLWADRTGESLTVLQEWYIPAEGLWETTGWWNAANVLTVLGDFARTGGALRSRQKVLDVIANTFTQAQLVVASAAKTVDAVGMMHSTYHRLTFDMAGIDKRGFAGFLNDFYDDEGWWALAWLRAFDVTGNLAYRDMAESIVADMAGGGNDTHICGGGIWWSKERTYKNAIANELYLAALASLANRIPERKADYTSRAQAQWAWFLGTGMINANNTINDGLTIHDDGTCTNNGLTVWSYNQGVVLGGLVELYLATGDASLVATAVAIARAAINELAVDGILHDGCDLNNGWCGDDGATFKGVFMRNLAYLTACDAVDADSKNLFVTFIAANANSIWDADRNDAGQFGVNYAGPPASGNHPTAGTHASGMDALVAAASIL